MQKKFDIGPKCMDTRYLPFDFFIIVNGMVGCIEYDGA